MRFTYGFDEGKADEHESCLTIGTTDGIAILVTASIHGSDADAVNELIVSFNDELTRLRAEVEELKRKNKELSDKFFASIVEDQMSKVIEKQIGVLPEMDKIVEQLQKEIEELKRNQLKPGEVRARWVNQIEPNLPSVLVEVKE